LINHEGDLKEMIKVLVIGGGFAGCCAAHLLSKKGWKVTIVEKEHFLGGGCKTHFYGGHPYTYGPRHFLTDKEYLFEFLNRYVPMRQIGDIQQNLTYIERDSVFYTFPVHEDDIEKMPDKEKIFKELKLSGSEDLRNSNFEEWVVYSLGPTLYDKFFETYSKKMWQIESNRELDATFGWREVKPKKLTLKTGSRATWDTGKISAFPKKLNGYDDYFRIATKNAEVCLDAKIETYDVENHRVKLEGSWRKFDIIVSTIFPEELLNNAFGPLRWIGRDFFNIVLPVNEALPPNIFYLYYANNEPFTRIVEYKKFYQYDAPTTLLSMELPSRKNRLYPYPTFKDQDLARRYFEALPENVFSIGRAGTYRYIDIDDIIQQCMDLDGNI